MNRIWAALMFFTRLPLWRWIEVPSDAFKRVVPLWPFAGWFTSIFSVGIFLLALQILPFAMALLVAIAARLLLTGALHEDGLADCFDGFGGGTSSNRILVIMKDSYIGSYGVIGLFFYFAFYYASLYRLGDWAAPLMLAADPFAKGVASQIINFLPYARKESEAKNNTVYSVMSYSERFSSVVLALLPLLWLPDKKLLFACFAPIVVFMVSILYFRKKIGGYTGDCCGALFLLCELSFLIASVVVVHTFMS